MGTGQPVPTCFQELLRAARAGSQEALGKLMEAFRRYLLQLGDYAICTALRPKGGASDLVQDTFLDAQRSFDRFRGDSPQEVCAWLRAIFLHNLSNFRRHYQGRSKRLITREVSLDVGRRGGRLSDMLEANCAPPDAQAIRLERTRLLRQAICKLPGEYRELVHLHSCEDLTFDEIGERLGCTAEAARKRWTRALRHLAHALEEKS